MSEITRDDVLEGFKDAIAIARTQSEPMTMIAGWREVGKMLGMYEAKLKIEITGELPGGTKDNAIVQFSNIIPFIVMKAMAMRDRLKEKDPYDIYYCLQHFPGGPQKIVELMQPVKSNGLVQESLGDARAAYYDYRKAQELAPDWLLPARQLKRFTVSRP